jgi:hypothetical protein
LLGEGQTSVSNDSPLIVRHFRYGDFTGTEIQTTLDLDAVTGSDARPKEALDSAIRDVLRKFAQRKYATIFDGYPCY